jgi:hypothetical protein
MKVCIIGASGKLGRYMVQHCLDRGYQVASVCREKSVAKLSAYKNRIQIFPGNTDDRSVISRAIEGCDGVLTVLVPWGVHGYSTGTAQAVLDFSRPDARLIFSCGWHITRDGKDVYDWKLKTIVAVFGPTARLLRIADLDDQVRACDHIFSSDKKWTVWSVHVGAPVLASNITRRVDFARFMVDALTNDRLIHEAPAIVSRRSKSALAHEWLS